MRVNVDSSAKDDPRMYLLARHLGVNIHEALGRILRVWFVCYDRRSTVLQPIEVDIAADRDGFAEAMLASGLAVNDEHGVYVRGVSERIEFLEKQSEKGRKSGEMRRQRSELRAPAQQGFAFGSNQKRTVVEQRFPSGSTNHRTYSPDLDQALAPDLDQDHPARDDRQSTPGSENAAAGPQANAKTPDPPDGDPDPEKRATGKPAREVPDQAVTLAHLLLGMITTNHPTARVSKAPERVREATALRWAETIDKINRIDGFEWGVIEGMIVWSQRDSFWRGVILGADNLRDKWDKMAAQRNRPGGVGRGTPAPSQLDALEQAAVDLQRKQDSRPKEPNA